jgi:hypothetical protein
LRADVQRLARRQNPAAQLDHGRPLALPPGCPRRQYPRCRPRPRLPTERSHLATHLEPVRPGSKQDPHRPVWPLSATPGAAPVARARRTPTRRASPRPPSGRLSRPALSNRRLPTCHARLLCLSRSARSYEHVLRPRPLEKGQPQGESTPASPNCQRSARVPPARLWRQTASNARCRSGATSLFAPIDARPTRSPTRRTLT